MVINYYYAFVVIRAEMEYLIGGTVTAASQAARAGAASTTAMTPLAGRSNYVMTEALMGIPDPGATAVAEAFHAAEEVFNGGPTTSSFNVPGSAGFGTAAPSTSAYSEPKPPSPTPPATPATEGEDAPSARAFL